MLDDEAVTAHVTLQCYAGSDRAAVLPEGSRFKSQHCCRAILGIESSRNASLNLRDVLKRCMFSLWNNTCAGLRMIMYVKLLTFTIQLLDPLSLFFASRHDLKFAIQINVKIATQ